MIGWRKCILGHGLEPIKRFSVMDTLLPHSCLPFFREWTTKAFCYPILQQLQATESSRIESIKSISAEQSSSILQTIEILQAETGHDEINTELEN